MTSNHADSLSHLTQNDSTKLRRCTLFPPSAAYKEGANSMSLLRQDLQRAGLAGAAIVFTMAALSAAFCSLIIFSAARDTAGFSRQTSLVTMGIFWLVCMIFTWRFLARARRSWPETLTSTSLFHAFQSVTIAVCLGFAACSGGLRSATLLWCGILIEFVVTLFYFSYIFLGFTLHYRMERSVIWGFLLAFGCLWWSSQHHPSLSP